MKISIGSDHGGFALKQEIIEHLKSKGYEVEDQGCHDTSSCDYPVYAKKVANDVAQGRAQRGIVICTTGIGVSITANKVKGIRAALCSDPLTARLTREHNDSNVLAMGAAIIGPMMAKEITDIFLSTEFSNGERHLRRVQLIED